MPTDYNYHSENGTNYTVSENAIPPDAEAYVSEQEVDAHVDRLGVSIYVAPPELPDLPDPPDYSVSMNAIISRLDALLDTVSANALPDEAESVSENAIMTTPLEEYGLTDSLLLIAVGLLLCNLVVTMFFKKE